MPVLIVLMFLLGLDLNRQAFADIAEKLEISEKEMLDAIMFGHEAIKEQCAVIICAYVIFIILILCNNGATKLEIIRCKLTISKVYRKFIDDPFPFRIYLASFRIICLLLLSILILANFILVFLSF